MGFGRRIEARVSQAMSKVERTASTADKAIVNLDAKVSGLIDEVQDEFAIQFVVDSDNLAPLVEAIKAMFLGQPRPAGEIVLPVSLRVVLDEPDEGEKYWEARGVLAFETYRSSSFRHQCRCGSLQTDQ